MVSHPILNINLKTKQGENPAFCLFKVEVKSMNKKELAKEIFNHPMMKILRESKGVDNKVLIRVLAEEILAEAESAGLRSVKGGIRRATNLKLNQEKLQANYDLQKAQLEAGQIKHKRFTELSEEEKPPPLNT